MSDFNFIIDELEELLQIPDIPVLLITSLFEKTGKLIIREVVVTAEASPSLDMIPGSEVRIMTSCGMITLRAECKDNVLHP